MEVIDFELQRLGVRHVRYCDDFLFVGDTPAEARWAMAEARRVLTEHGLRINETKTEGPAQQIVFLGLELDSVQQSTRVPLDKVNELKTVAGAFANKSNASKKQLQSLVGKFSFVATALPGARPFFRSLIDATRGMASCWSRTSVSRDMLYDLKSWLHFLDHCNGRARWVRGEEVVIAHDASKSGFGFALNGLPSDFETPRLPVHLRPGNGFAGVFTKQHVSKVSRSIQYAELFAIAASVALYAPFIENRALLVTTDNLADVHIINRQSTSAPDLLPLLRAIYATCARYNISLRALHVAGVDNTLADYLSRPALHSFTAHIPHCISPQTTRAHFILSSGLALPSMGTRPATFTRC
jgi:hypothetical protein